MSEAWGEKNNYTAQWKSFFLGSFLSKELWASHNIVNEIAFWLYKSFWFSVLYKSCKMDLDRRLPIDHGFLRLPAASETSFHLRLQQPWMMALSTAVFSSFITWLGSSDLTTAVPDTIMLAPAWWRDKKNGGWICWFHHYKNHSLTFSSKKPYFIPVHIPGWWRVQRHRQPRCWGLDNVVLDAGPWASCWT